MGQPLFGINISGLIKQYVGTGLPSVVLRKRTKTSRTAGQLTGGTNPTETDYTCKGVILRQEETHRSDAKPVSNGTRQILLIGDTISNGTVFPVLGDRIVAEGSIWVIDGPINRDPAKATYVCTVRKA